MLPGKTKCACSLNVVYIINIVMIIIYAVVTYMYMVKQVFHTSNR